MSFVVSRTTTTTTTTTTAPAPRVVRSGRRQRRAHRSPAANARDDDEDGDDANRERKTMRASSSSSSPAPPMLLRPEFTTTDIDALTREPLLELSPTWRMTLLSDGSVTRHLAALGRARRTRVEVLWQGPEDDAQASYDRPREVETMIKAPVVRREVLLRAGNACGEGAEDVPAVYAASWWNAEDAREFMPDETSSMWTNLRARHVELHREIREVCCGRNERLEEVFGEAGPFWARHYIFWSGGAPITIVYEVFNPALRHALGE